MRVTNQLMNDIKESFTGESRFCEIVQNGEIIAWDKRLIEARKEIQNGYWGRGIFLITQRKADRTLIHETVKCPSF